MILAYTISYVCHTVQTNDKSGRVWCILLWYEHLGQGFCCIYSYIHVQDSVQYRCSQRKRKNITYNRATVRCKDERNTRQHALTGRTHRWCWGRTQSQPLRIASRPQWTVFPTRPEQRTPNLLQWRKQMSLAASSYFNAVVSFDPA